MKYIKYVVLFLTVLAFSMTVMLLSACSSPASTAHQPGDTADVPSPLEGDATFLEMGEPTDISTFPSEPGTDVDLALVSLTAESCTVHTSLPEYVKPGEWALNPEIMRNILAEGRSLPDGVVFVEFDVSYTNANTYPVVAALNSLTIGLFRLDDPRVMPEHKELAWTKGISVDETRRDTHSSSLAAGATANYTIGFLAEKEYVANGNAKLVVDAGTMGAENKLIKAYTIKDQAGSK